MPLLGNRMNGNRIEIAPQTESNVPSRVSRPAGLLPASHSAFRAVRWAGAEPSNELSCQKRPSSRACAALT